MKVIPLLKDVQAVMIKILLFSLIILSGSVMAYDAGNRSNRGHFALSWDGDQQFGSRSISFDGESRYRLSIGDTVNSDSRFGVGIFELNLQSDDLRDAQRALEALCDKDIQSREKEVAGSFGRFSVSCVDDGKIVHRSGLLGRVPDDLRKKFYAGTLGLSEKAFQEGKKILKLDFSTSKIERKGEKFIVSIAFKNSGERWIKFTTPDQWASTTTRGSLGIGPVKKVSSSGALVDAGDVFGFGLSGKKIANAEDFPDGYVFLNPHESKIIKIETSPDFPGTKGEYEFSGVAFMDIEFEGDDGGVSSVEHVDFRPIKTRITIDRDYPSTPEEREQWEATHRADMSSRPVKPGQTFPEDGLYRAVQMSGGIAIRSLQLTPFKAGDVAPTESVKMLTEYASGTELDKPAQWLWAGSAPTPVKQWSSDLIDGTQQHCAAGDVCPRSGRWVARVHSGDWKYRYDLAGIVTRKRGERMPDAGDDTGHGGWEWLGV